MFFLSNFREMDCLQQKPKTECNYSVRKVKTSLKRITIAMETPGGGE